MIIVMAQTLHVMNQRGYQIDIEGKEVIEFPTYVKIIDK